MKKLVSLLLALCLVCLSTAALAAGADITGDWYGTMYGMGVTLTLNADNTYKLLMGENELPGTYELKDGIVYMDGDTDAANGFVYDGTTLVNEKQSVTFTRDAEAAQSITLAEVNTEAKLEDFAGEWVCKYVSMNGMVVDVTAIPVEQLGASQIPGMKIEGNTMILTGLESMTGANPLEMEFADGALSIDLGKMLAEASQSAGMDLSSLGLDNLQMTLGVMLLKDGMASLYINAMGQEIAFIFEPAPAAAETPAA